MIKFAQYPIALASIVAILIGTQSFDAAIPHTKVENPNLKVELFAQGSNSSQAPRLHTATLTLDTIPDVLWGSSTTLRGKLIDSNASDAGVGGQTITFSGTGAANVGSVTTNTDGTFTISGLAPNTVGTGWTVQAHYAGDSIASYTPSDSTTNTYNTIKHTFSLVLSNTPYVFWNSSTSFTATLADFADGAGTKTPPSGKTVTFTGSGVISSASTITATTDSNGKATGMGTSPNTVASGWTTQAHFVGDSQYNAADSNTQSYNTLKHTASLTPSSLAPNVPWTSPTSFPVLLADLNRGNAPISGRTIHFAGTGIINVADSTTDNVGSSDGTGKAPSLVATGWTYQAQFAGDSLYNAANTNIQTYSTLKHTTSITLDTITYVPSGMTVTVTGKLTDSSASYAAIGSQTITFTGTGAANLASVVTTSDGTFAASGIAPNSIAPGWTIQAHYSGNVNYMSSDSNTQTYNTLNQTSA